MLLSKTCVASAAVLFAFDILFSFFLLIAAARAPDAASGRTSALNFYRGFVLYVTPHEYWIFVGTLAGAGILFLLGVLFYTRISKAARGEA